MMAEQVKGSVAGEPKVSANDRMAAARSATRVRKNYGYDCTPGDKLSIANLQAAKRACTLAIEQIRRGNEVPGEVVRSASILAGATAALLQDR